HRRGGVAPAGRDRLPHRGRRPGGPGGASAGRRGVRLLRGGVVVRPPGPAGASRRPGPRQRGDRGPGAGGGRVPGGHRQLPGDGGGGGLVTGGVALAIGVAAALMLTVPAPVRDEFGAPDLVKMFADFRTRDAGRRSLLDRVPDVTEERARKKSFPAA